MAIPPPGPASTSHCIASRRSRHCSADSFATSRRDLLRIGASALAAEALCTSAISPSAERVQDEKPPSCGGDDIHSTLPATGQSESLHKPRQRRFALRRRAGRVSCRDGSLVHAAHGQYARPQL